MAEKGQLHQKPKRAFLYSAKVSREKTQAVLVRDLLNRAFGGSANALVAQLLQQTHPTGEELEAILTTISDDKRKKGE